MDGEGMEDPNWLQKKAKWILPLSCLGTFACVALVAGIMALTFGLIRSSDVYIETLARVQAHSGATAVLGEPLTDGWLPSGNIETGGGAGSADLSIPISGPNGSGRVYAQARRIAGVWEFSSLVLVIDGSEERIDLLE